jgi:hypothetical protein
VSELSWGGGGGGGGGGREWVSEWVSETEGGGERLGRY